MTPRSVSIRAVSGRARISGRRESGNRRTEKKTPERTIIGKVTRLISPEIVAVVRARLARSVPRPAKESAPAVAVAAREKADPAVDTPKKNHESRRRGATSSGGEGTLASTRGTEK